MNCGILEDLEFQINIDKMLQEFVDEQEDFEEKAECWDHA